MYQYYGRTCHVQSALHSAHCMAAALRPCNEDYASINYSVTQAPLRCSLTSYYNACVNNVLAGHSGTTPHCLPSTFLDPSNARVSLEHFATYKSTVRGIVSTNRLCQFSKVKLAKCAITVSSLSFGRLL